MSLVLVVNIKKSFSTAEKAKLRGEDCDISRKSIKDMTIKYWTYTPLKNKVDDIVIVAGLKEGRICSAFKVNGYQIVGRIGKEETYQERVEFLYEDSFDDIVGLDLKNYENLSRGGWVTKTFDLDELISNTKDQGEDSVKANREELFNYYEKIGIPYNPKESYDYSQYYYGGKGSSYKRSASVRKKTIERSNFTCECCGKNDCNLYCHHIDLVSQGGEDSEENTISVCLACHQAMHSNPRYNEDIKPKLKQLRIAKNSIKTIINNI